MKRIPESQWRWDGHAGHFVASSSCRFHLHTRVGNYRVSTVGDYYPSGHTLDEPAEIGAGRTHETYVFRVSGRGVGRVDSWTEIEARAYSDCDEARDGHMAMCRKYAEAPR